MKKLFAFILAAALMAACSLAVAETQISVSGSGETRIRADTAVISLGVNARDKDVLKAQQQVNDAIAAIRKALMDQGAMYDYQDDREKLAAYNASSTLAIKVTEMENVGSLIDLCFAAGANTLNGVSFSASDTEEAEAEALKDAVADAKKKAEILAEASGLKITGIETLSEGGIYTYDNNIGNVFDAKRLTEESAGTIVQSAKLLVSASVSITFTAE